MNYWEIANNFLPEIIGSVIGACSTVIVLFIALHFEKENEISKTHKLQIETLQLFTTLIVSVIKTTKDQIELMDTFCTKFMNDSYEIPTLDLTPNRSLERLIPLLGTGIYYQSFIENLDDKKLSINEYMNICFKLDFFDLKFKEIISMHQKSSEFDKKRKIIYQKSIDNGFVNTGLLNKISANNQKLNQDMKAIFHFLRGKMLTSWILLQIRLHQLQHP